MSLSMIKKINVIGLMIAFAIVLSSCSKEVSCEEDPTQDKCVVVEPSCEEDPTQDKCQEEPALTCKAINYDYDEDDLNYQLVFSDEFDTDHFIDPDVWRFETGGGGWGNNELQYYTDGLNADVIDGKLVITARKEEYEGSPYTSSRIISRNREDFLYGKIEIRAKVPSGRGTWSAIWMMPTDSRYGTWPNSGEIDIMEHVGYNEGIIYSTIHNKVYNHKLGTQKGNSTYVEDATSEFHVYSVEWLPDKVIFSVDDTVFFTYQPSLYSTCPEYDKWPYDKRFYLIFNVAVGGDWGGAQGVDSSAFPTTMEIDYVRVYQSDIITNLEQSIPN